jgi:hypothetical protein
VEPNATPPVLVTSGVKVAKGVIVAAGVFVGAANAVAVNPAAKVLTACVRISSGLMVTVGVSWAAVAPQALSNKAPSIIKACIPIINLGLSILSPFHKRRYFTCILQNSLWMNTLQSSY